MAWTYDGDPSANARDAIRFLVGDTDTNDQLITDAEIAWVNNQVTGSDTATTGLYDAAYRVCLTIASKFSRDADKSVGDLSISANQKAAAYRLQAEEIKRLATREGNVPTPYAGGISIGDKDVDRSNSDVNHGWFSSGQFVNQRGGAEKVVSDYTGSE
jgi:hypothetical protein